MSRVSETGGAATRAIIQPVKAARRLRKRMTPQEVKLWNWPREGLVPQGHHFRRQVGIEGYIVDFACLRASVVIEVDGGGHGTDAGLAADSIRDARMIEAGFRVLPFWNHEIDHGKEAVPDTVRRAVTDRSFSPPGRFAATLPSRGGITASRRR